VLDAVGGPRSPARYAMSPHSVGAGRARREVRASPTADHARWFFERLVAVFGLLLCAKALVPLYVAGDAVPAKPLDEANVLFQAVSGSVYLIALAMLVPRWRDVLGLLAKNSALLLLCLLPATSLLWSLEPEVAVRRGTALLLTFGFALWLALRFRPSTVLRMTVAALSLGAIASLAAAILMPEVGQHAPGSHSGLWRGTFGHKNVMGRMMSLAVVVSALLIATSRSAGVVPRIVVALAAPLILMSGSATAVATTFLALVILPASTWLSKFGTRPRIVAVATLGAAIIATVTMLAFLEPILGLLGRDITLSGRLRLWELALAEGFQQPLLGAGFRTFWLEGAPGGRVMESVSWGEGNIGNGHSGYVDLWLELGMAGAIIYLLLLKEATSRVIALISQRDPLGVWLGVLLVHISTYSVTERILLEHSDLSWLLFMVLLLQATPALAPARRPWPEVASKS
jgi:exopolysaccharide production protein ExoQ